MTGDGRRVRDIHQLGGALVGEFKMLSEYSFAAVIAGLRSGISE
jgi:hypothetical protein